MIGLILQENIYSWTPSLSKNNSFSWYNTLYSLFPSSLKKPKKRLPQNSVAWWDEELEQMRKAKYKCLKMWRLDHTLESVDDVVRLPQAVNFLFPRIPNKVRELFQQDKTSAFLDYRTLGYFIGNGSNNFFW